MGPTSPLVSGGCPAPQAAKSRPLKLAMGAGAGALGPGIRVGALTAGAPGSSMRSMSGSLNSGRSRFTGGVSGRRRRSISMLPARNIAPGMGWAESSRAGADGLAITVSWATAAAARTQSKAPVASAKRIGNIYAFLYMGKLRSDRVVRMAAHRHDR